jgi:transposase
MAYAVKKASQSCAVHCPAGNCVANAEREEGIAQGLYYKWSKDFLEAGKKRLAGDITRQANHCTAGYAQHGRE